VLLHIGEQNLVRGRAVIGFFDLDGGETPEITREFLRRAEKEGVCELLTTDIPRSFVLTEEKVYITRLSTQALHRRSSSGEGK